MTREGTMSSHGMQMPCEALDAALRTRSGFVETLFDDLRALGTGERGVTRASYGEGEQCAHDHVAAIARDLGLSTTTDSAGNLMMTWEGLDPTLPAWITGSHLDSVHEGGNFDGAAGVVAGLTAIAALMDAGCRFERTVIVVAWRAEEVSTWFEGRHRGHFGSRAALGIFDRAELDSTRHIMTGASFRETLTLAGFDPERFGTAPSVLPERTAGYVEVHIEQGPVLEEEGVPIAIVTAVRGTTRLRSALIQGAYSHSGAVPRAIRQDAVFAFSDLVMSFDRAWTKVEGEDRDLVVTFGKASTDHSMESLTKVPGEVRFGIDIRSTEASVLNEMEQHLLRCSREIERNRRVRFELGSIDRNAPAVMDASIVEKLTQTSRDLSIPLFWMGSGGAHDACDVHDAGIPASMIFVRNRNGSHNPDELMELQDLAVAVRLLAYFLLEVCQT